MKLGKTLVELLVAIRKLMFLRMGWADEGFYVSRWRLIFQNRFCMDVFWNMIMKTGESLFGLTSNMNICPSFATDVVCWDIVVMNVLKEGEALAWRILWGKNGVPDFRLLYCDTHSHNGIANLLHNLMMIGRLVSLTWLIL